MKKSIVATIALIGLWTCAGVGCGALLPRPGGAAGGGGGVQLVVTTTEYPDFAAARAHAVTEIQDGAPLWLYAKFEAPLQAHASTVRFTEADGSATENVAFNVVAHAAQGNARGSSEAAVFVKGGEKAGAGQVVRKSTTTRLVGVDPATATEFKLLLSSYVRGKSTYAVLKAINGAGAGAQTVSIGLVGKNGDELARIELKAQLAAGLKQYRAAWTAYEQVINSGDIADNELPPMGKFRDNKVRDAVSREATTSGVRPERIYFTRDTWSEFESTQVNLLKERVMYGCVIYQVESRWFYMMVEVQQRLGKTGDWSGTTVKLYDRDSPIDPAKVKAL